MTVQLIKNTYFDAKDGRWVCICKQGDFIRYHKIPREIVTKDDAEAYAAPLGMEFRPNDNHGWGKPFKSALS